MTTNIWMLQILYSRQWEEVVYTCFFGGQRRKNFFMAKGENLLHQKIEKKSGKVHQMNIEICCSDFEKLALKNTQEEDEFKATLLLQWIFSPMTIIVILLSRQFRMVSWCNEEYSDIKIYSKNRVDLFICI